MIDPTASASPRPPARLTGIVYLLYFLTAILAQFLMRGLVMPADAAATAVNLHVHETIFRLGLALSLVAIAWYIALTALFYRMFEPVDRTLSLLAAFFSLVGCAVQAFASAFQLAPSVLLGGATYLSVFKLEQLQALSLMFLKWGSQAFNIGLIFFGFYCLFLGYLIFRSDFLPRFLGVLMSFAGLGWLAFLSPHLVISMSPYIQIFGVLAEAALMLWLLVKGVNVQLWQRRVGATRKDQ